MTTTETPDPVMALQLRIEDYLRKTRDRWHPQGDPVYIAALAVDAMGDQAAEMLADRTLLKGMRTENGQFVIETEPAQEVLEILAGSMRQMLESMGAENYVEFEMETGPPPAPASVAFDIRNPHDRADAYTLTIQRQRHPTPHEFRAQAEELLALAHELRIPVFTQHEGYAEVVVERGPGPHRGMFGVTDGAAHLRSTWVEGEGWKPIRDVGPAATYRHTLAAAVDLARHVAAMEAANPRLAGQPASEGAPA